VRDLIVLGAHALGPLGTGEGQVRVFRIICEANCPFLTIASGKREDVNDNTETVSRPNLASVASCAVAESKAAAYAPSGFSRPVPGHSMLVAA
jgi:hypothetical protein